MAEDYVYATGCYERTEGGEEMKTKMTLQELHTMIGMANTITFAKNMKRAEQADIERQLLACINEWLRGDDEPTRIKRAKEVKK